MNDAVPAAPGDHEWAAPTGPAPVPDAVAAPAAPAAAATPATRAAVPTYRSWQPGLIPLRPMSFGEFIGVPFKAMRFNRAVVIGGPLLVVGGAMLVLAAALWMAFTDPSLALLSPDEQLEGIQTSTIGVAIAAGVALILADALASAVVAPGVARASLGERITVRAAFRAVGARIPSLLLLWLMSILAVAVAVLPGLALVVVGVRSGSGVESSLGVLAMVGLGGIAAVPVYLVSAIARCVIVLERKGAVASVRRALRVIKGRFWWSLLILITTGAIITVVTSVFQQAAYLVGAVIAMVGFNGGWWTTAIMVAFIVLASVIGYVITYTYMGCVYALIYIDARIRHEGFDMDMARAAEARRA